MSLVKTREDEVNKYVRPGHMNAYGFRKGSATLASTGTTVAPPLPSILRRGEWSMGAVLDVYLHFPQAGDCYLGRILAGLDPNDEKFATLP